MRLDVGNHYGDGYRRLYLNDALIGFVKAKHGIVSFRGLGECESVRFVGLGELKRYIVSTYYLFL